MQNLFSIIDYLCLHVIKLLKKNFFQKYIRVDKREMYNSYQFKTIYIYKV